MADESKTPESKSSAQPDPRDCVETASTDSFPASDPPGWICCSAKPSAGSFAEKTQAKAR